MLDFSDKKPTISGHKALAQREAVRDVKAEVRPGDRFRHYKGALYEITGTCTIEATQETGIRYKSVDPLARKDEWMRPFSDFFSTLTGGVSRFAALRKPSDVALREYLDISVIRPDALATVLGRYAEPGRYFHSLERVYDLFDRAKALDLNLTPDQRLALLFLDVVYCPGAAEGANERLSALYMQSLSAYFENANIKRISQIIEDTARHKSTCPDSEVVLDLAFAFLSDDPIHFCASDELIWLENRHLLDPENPRKDYDTRRLKFLLNMAERGPLYRSVLSDMEERARTNLEGLRQAWVAKYTKERSAA